MGFLYQGICQISYPHLSGWESVKVRENVRTMPLQGSAVRLKSQIRLEASFSGKPRLFQSVANISEKPASGGFAQFDPEAASFARLGIDPELAAHALDDGADESQADACSSLGH